MIFAGTRLGCDVTEVFPYSAMLQQLQKFGRFGLYMAVLIVPMLTTDANAIPDLDELSQNYLNGEENVFKPDEQRLNQRLSDIIVDLHRLGYI